MVTDVEPKTEPMRSERRDDVCKCDHLRAFHYMRKLQCYAPAIKGVFDRCTCERFRSAGQ